MTETYLIDTQGRRLVGRISKQVRRHRKVQNTGFLVIAVHHAQPVFVQMATQSSAIPALDFSVSYAFCFCCEFFTSLWALWLYAKMLTCFSVHSFYLLPSLYVPFGFRATLTSELLSLCSLMED